MRIRELYIRKFRNLKNFEIKLDGELVNVLLGKNGAAKSNLLEAIAQIFAELEMEKEPTFYYRILYTCRTKEIEIDAGYSEPSNLFAVIDGTKISYRQFVNKEGKHYQNYLPTNIFIYYSGSSWRMDEVCSPVYENYKGKLRDGANPRLRRIFLTDGSHSSRILFTFIADDSDTSKKFLRERLGITGIVSIHLWLLPPPNSHFTRKLRYWHSTNSIYETLTKLANYSIPLRELEYTPPTSKEKAELFNLNSLHFYFDENFFPPSLLLKSENSKDGFGSATNPSLPPYTRAKDLFQRLDDLRIAGYRFGIRFRLRLDRAKDPVSLDHLSEGEQQLLTVIGLLRFTKENDTLFLLDEPDTHLNPQWSYEYKKMLEEAVQNEDGSTDSSSQIIMATHDPVLIAGLTKENVRLMERKSQAEAPDEAEWIIEARPPDEDPQGKGVARILESELFGLPSILDQESLDKLEEKRRLAFKEEALTAEEEARLDQLALETQDIDLTTHIEDPLYTHFVNAIVNHEDYLLLKRHYSTDTRFTALKRVSEKVREELLRKAQTAEVSKEEEE